MRYLMMGLVVSCAGCASVADAAAGMDSLNTVWNAQKERAKTAMPANAVRVKAELAAAEIGRASCRERV